MSVRKHTPHIILSVKLTVLLSCVIFLFIVARARDLVMWQWQPKVRTTSLSVGHLRELLEQRGVSYETAVEKSELVQLVQDSGPVTLAEVKSLQRADDDSTEETHFASGLDFYKQVEHSRDGAWLVMVIAGDAVKSRGDGGSPSAAQSSLADKTWRQRVERLGVRTGVLECRLDSEWCMRRKWYSSRLLLSLPKASGKAPEVFTYSGTLTQRPVYRWLLETLRLNVWKVTGPPQLQQNWLTFRNPLQRPEMHAVLLTDKTSPPASFAAVSAQFQDTVKFAWVDTSSLGFAAWTKELDIKTELSVPVILVATNEGVYIYGQASDECFTYHCIRTFINHFRPSQNFALNASFTLAIILPVLNVFIYKKRLIKRVILNTLINCAVTIVIWLVLSSDKVAFVRFVNTQAARVTGFLAVTSVGAMIRSDVLFFSRHPFLLFLSLLPSIWLMKMLIRELIGDTVDEEDKNTNASLRAGVSTESLTGRNNNYEADIERGVRTYEREINFMTDGDEASREEDSMIRRGGRTLSIVLQNGDTYQGLTAEGMQVLANIIAEMQSMPVANPHDVTQLPEWSYNAEEGAPEGFLECQQCVICLEDFSEGDLMTGLPCQHVFHHSCLVSWLNGGVFNKCPLCRA